MNVCLVSPLARRGPWTRPEYGVGSWPLALGGDLWPYDADPAPLADYDVLLLHVDWAHYDRIAAILDRFAAKPVVLMLTCDAMFIDPQGFFPGFHTPLKALMDRATLIVSETEELGFFQAMTATPVVHLPLPVPVAAMRAAARPWEGEAPAEPTSRTISRSNARLGRSLALPADPRNGTGDDPRGRLGRSLALPAAADDGPVVYLGAGFRAKKNGVATAMAFRRLREAVPGIRGVVFVEDTAAEAEAYRAWGVEGVETRPVCEQQALWPQIAACDLALHLDYRRTIGRFSGECAALGTPCISTAGATMQRACFPELIAEPWDVERAVVLARRLLTDPVFRQRQVARAACAIERYGLAPTAARLHRHLRRTAAGA